LAREQAIGFWGTTCATWVKVQQTLVSLMLHIVLPHLGFRMRNKREKTECKKCYVGLCISECFEDYHTRSNLLCGISEWCMFLS
jgi:hypothetical protein